MSAPGGGCLGHGLYRVGEFRGAPLLIVRRRPRPSRAPAASLRDGSPPLTARTPAPSWAAMGSPLDVGGPACRPKHPPQQPSWSPSTISRTGMSWSARGALRVSMSADVGVPTLTRIMQVSDADEIHEKQGAHSVRFGCGNHGRKPALPTLLAVVVFAADISAAKTTTASKVNKSDEWDEHRRGERRPARAPHQHFGWPRWRGAPIAPEVSGPSACPCGGGNPSLPSMTPGTRQSRVAAGHREATPKAPLTGGGGVEQ